MPSTAPRFRVPRKIVALLSLLVLLGCLLGVNQVFAVYRSALICRARGMSHYRADLRRYGSEHDGRLPDAADWQRITAKWSREPRSGCDTGADYVWRRTPPPGPSDPAVWCGQPHGVLTRWRNVAFADGRLGSLSEADFERTAR